MATTPSRGYTNLLTGSVHLFDIPVNALTKFIVKGRLPKPFFSSFLHEATHFWCMASDLGSFLALLEMRIHRHLIKDPPEPAAVVRDAIVGDAMRKFLTPLLEGMALFAEFDACPGSADVFSKPGAWAATMFLPLEGGPPGPEKGKEVEWLEHRIISELVDYRFSSRAIDRKTDILLQPLTESRHGYLVGYLTVKLLWATAADRKSVV